ncbi:putative UDP-3-O-[3-hydroxymyristoyl] N-acetylglucosamine deacetylase 1 [Capsicum annuum]|nr:putative UDP-3-O-[3-hydroxymyristoyl] N-acetylglucosamine deacetylase 1 [Capsicum annuum]
MGRSCDEYSIDIGDIIGAGNEAPRMSCVLVLELEILTGLAGSGGGWVPILDGSAREWVDAIEEAGLKEALDRSGKSCEKLAPVLREPVTVWKNDSFIAAFPYSKIKITYGIDFPQVYLFEFVCCAILLLRLGIKISGTSWIGLRHDEESEAEMVWACDEKHKWSSEVVHEVGYSGYRESHGYSGDNLYLHEEEAPEIGCQWFSSTYLDKDFFTKELASARTFCIYEQVEQLRESGVIKGGSAKNAIVCSESRGWLNPPLRFSDEPCRHKVLDLIGDLSLLAHGGNQGLPVAHIIVYKYAACFSIGS